MRFTSEQELAPGGFSGGNGVFTLPSVAEADDEAYQVPLLETPLLVGGESYEFAAIANLDLFFTRVYRYWHERGLSSILLAGALNLLALAFTAAFSTFLLLFVDWRALHAECLAPRAGGGSGTGGGADGDPTGGTPGGCDLAAVALDRRPLLGRGFGADLLALSYITVCVTYLGWTAAHFLLDARDMREVAHFMANKLGISEGKVVAMTWAEVVHRLVLVQRTTRLCIARDLDELHIVSRIMRKENYLISMINRNVLQLHLQPPSDAPRPVRRVLGAALRLLGGAGPGGGCGGGRGCPPMLTKTLEWNLRWCILDHMFDDRFRIRPEFSDVAALRRRLRLVALANLLLSPFVLMFLLAYFFMRNAERLYHHPAALGSRRWSGLAKWRIRELNELPHYLHHRLSASHPAALRYVAQFPSHTLAALARFMVFITGSFVALLLFVTFLDESLLERPLLGRQVVWWLGTLTVVLATCRTLVSEEPVAYDPERALADVVSYTHYLPRHWRGRAHTAEVQSAFLSLFRLKVALFVEELASLVTTPLVLACSLPACADSIVEFVSTFTTHVDGVGDVCSLATFDLARHGNTKYGAPAQAEKALRSRQGKLEKSFLTFVATYPTWEPGEVGRHMLACLAASGGTGAAAGGGGGGGATGNTGTAGGPESDGTAPVAPAPAENAVLPPRPAADALPYHQDPPSAFPYHAAAGASKMAAAATAGAAGATAAAATSALARAACGGLQRASSSKEASLSGYATDPSQAVAGEKAAAAAAAGPLLSASIAAAAAASRPPLPPPPALNPAGLPPGRSRPPSLPFHMMPYHGVRSYTSTASASHLSAGGGGGWAWRPPSTMSSGGGAAAGLAGISPAPSVASSQFSNLAAPYLQYYPVPLYYAHQQQARHAAQQQYRRMYDHLLHGVMASGAGGGGSSGSGGMVRPFAGASAAGLGLGGHFRMPPSPPQALASPYDRRMASSSLHAASWQHHSSPQPYDVYGLPYSGVFRPYAFHPGTAAAAVPPFPPGGFPAGSGPLGAGPVSPTAASGCSEASPVLQPGTVNEPGMAAVSAAPAAHPHAGACPKPPLVDTEGSPRPQQPAEPALGALGTRPGPGRELERGPDGGDAASVDSPTASWSWPRREVQPVRFPLPRQEQQQQQQQEGEQAQGAGAIGSMPLPASPVNDIREHTGTGSSHSPPEQALSQAKGRVGEPRPGGHGSAARAAAGACASDGSGGAHAAGISFSGCGSSSGVAGGSSGIAAGCGSDILDMRGVEDMALPPASSASALASAAGAGDAAGTASCSGCGPGTFAAGSLDDVEDDPLGLSGFVRLPDGASPASASASAMAAGGTAAGLQEGAAGGAGMEDVEGFGVVSRPAGPTSLGSVSSSSGIVLRRWGPSGAASASGSVSASASVIAVGQLQTPLPPQQQQQQQQQQPQGLASASSGASAGPAGLGSVGNSGSLVQPSQAQHAQAHQREWLRQMEQAAPSGAPQDEGPDGWQRLPSAAGQPQSANGSSGAPPLRRGVGSYEGTRVDNHEQQEQPQPQPQPGTQQSGLPQPSPAPAQSQLSEPGPRPLQDPGLAASEDPTASQLYYSADYYAAASPYYGLDEYDTMCDYGVPMYGYADVQFPGDAGHRPLQDGAGSVAVLPDGVASGTWIAAPPAAVPEQASLTTAGWAGHPTSHHPAVGSGLLAGPRPGQLPPAHLPPLSQSQQQQLGQAASIHYDAQSSYGYDTMAPAAWQGASASSAAAPSTLIRSNVFATATRGLQAHRPPSINPSSSLGAPERASTAAVSAAPMATVATLPTNETAELDSRVLRGHSLLQSLYESNDHTVQHRLQQQLHARSLHGSRGGGLGDAGGSDGNGAAWGGAGSGRGSRGGADLGGAGISAWEQGSRGFGWAPPESPRS